MFKQKFIKKPQNDREYICNPTITRDLKSSHKVKTPNYIN